MTRPPRRLVRLSAEDVKRLVKTALTPGVTQAEVARRFGVSPRYVRNAVAAAKEEKR